RSGEPCLICETPIKSLTIGQRNTFYCPQCQR
ncbi:MAG TPA: DNA-formamidopyrimidine glycosylase, partial [Alteromonas sp.]|nr:DNA-formamidopyrimidine glycosylase [Alteromonas sp.]